MEARAHNLNAVALIVDQLGTTLAKLYKIFTLHTEVDFTFISLGHPQRSQTARNIPHC